MGASIQHLGGVGMGWEHLGGAVLGGEHHSLVRGGVGWRRDKIYENYENLEPTTKRSKNLKRLDPRTAGGGVRAFSVGDCGVRKWSRWIFREVALQNP